MCSSCVTLFGISITSTKYWPPSTIWRFLSELVLLLPNTDRLQQFEDFCQSLFYFYQILTALNNLKIFVRAFLLLPNTDCLQKFEYFVRGCTCQLQKIKTIWRHRNVWILLYAKLSIIAFISWREHILYIKFLIYIDWLVLNIYSIDNNMFQWIIGIRLNTFQLFLLI